MAILKITEIRGIEYSNSKNETEVAVLITVTSMSRATIGGVSSQRILFKNNNRTKALYNYCYSVLKESDKDGIDIFEGIQTVDKDITVDGIMVSKPIPPHYVLDKDRNRITRKDGSHVIQTNIATILLGEDGNGQESWEEVIDQMLSGRFEPMEKRSNMDHSAAFAEIDEENDDEPKAEATRRPRL